MANNKQYIDLLNAVASQEENRLITVAIFGIVLVLVTLLLPSKILTLKFGKSSRSKKCSNQIHSKKEKNRDFCYKFILVTLAFILLIAGGIYKTIELRKIKEDTFEKNFMVYEGSFQFNSLYHDYYYGRIDFLDENGVITGYAFYPDRTNSHQTYSSNTDVFAEGQICKGIVVYSQKSKIVLDLTVITE